MMLVLAWNWKAALLSGLFRAALFAVVAVRRGSGGTSEVWIELACRLAIGGSRGLLTQAFWPTAPHRIEFAALLAGWASAPVSIKTLHITNCWAEKSVVVATFYRDSTRGNRFGRETR